MFNAKRLFQSSLEKGTLGLVLLALILATVFYLWKNGQASMRTNMVRLAIETERNLESLSLNESDIVIGDTDSRVTMIEYFDLECPHCRRYAKTDPDVVSRYLPKDVAFVYRHFPLEKLHVQALDEALALECVALLRGRDAYMSYRSRILASGPGNDSLDLPLLDVWAEELGIDKTTFSDCRASAAPKDKIRRDLILGTVEGVYSTPSFVFYKDGIRILTMNAAQTGTNWSNVWAVLESLTKQ